MSDNKQWLDSQPQHNNWTRRKTIITFVSVFFGIILAVSAVKACNPQPATRAPIGSSVTDAGKHVAEQVQSGASLVPAPTMPPVPPDQTSSGIGDGTYEVGAEIAPGKYKSQGTAPGNLGSCYWARLKGTDEIRDLITNHYGDGLTTVVVAKTDKYFKTEGCAGWVQVPG